MLNYIIITFFTIKIDSNGNILSTSLFAVCFMCVGYVTAYHIYFYRKLKQTYPTIRFRSLFKAKHFLAKTNNDVLYKKAKTAVELFVCILILIFEFPLFMLIGMLLRV